MKLEKIFLRSKVARRIFMLFIICALLPISVLAILSFSQVTKQLYEQSQDRLHQNTKAMAMAILERLLFIEADMEVAAFNLKTSSRTTLDKPAQEPSAKLKERFKSLAIIDESGSSMLLFGRIQNIPEITPAEMEQILSGEILLSTEFFPNRPSRIFMRIALDPIHGDQEILLAEINPNFLWSEDKNELPPMTELCILSQPNNILISSLPPPLSFPDDVVLKMSRNHQDNFKWTHKEEEYLASFWSIFLQSHFISPEWIVVMIEPKTHVLAPMVYFKKIITGVTLASLWVVLLLSISQIRRSLVPLEKLKEGTRRIAQRDFDSRVIVKSRDEFEEVAASFNTMARQLGRQFKALTTMAEIDRAILSSLDTEKIVDTVLHRMRDVFPCNLISMTLVDSKSPNKAHTYTGEDKKKNEKLTEPTDIKPEEMQKLSDNPETLLIELDKNLPSYLAPLAGRGIKSFLVLPIFLKQKLSGIITLGYLKPPVLTQDDLSQARQMADQVAVAFSNAQLIDELEQLNWGTLTALARAIDAKSHWTAGHSERCTKLALQIGRVLGLTSDEIDNLHRGGLLHDIGKLGIPGDILDKTGNLTAKEKQLMHKHVLLGARILEPISAYAEAIPIVLHHHEYFDGSGYPDGLAGKAINLNARIFVVTDHFDAVTSDRPYRKGFDRKKGIKFIKQGAGKLFDPKVVQAFLEVMSREEKE